MIFALHRRKAIASPESDAPGRASQGWRVAHGPMITGALAVEPVEA